MDRRRALFYTAAGLIGLGVGSVVNAGREALFPASAVTHRNLSDFQSHLQNPRVAENFLGDKVAESAQENFVAIYIYQSSDPASSQGLRRLIDTMNDLKRPVTLFSIDRDVYPQLASGLLMEEEQPVFSLIRGQFAWGPYSGRLPMEGMNEIIREAYKDWDNYRLETGVTHETSLRKSPFQRHFG